MQAPAVERVEQVPELVGVQARRVFGLERNAQLGACSLWWTWWSRTCFCFGDRGLEAKLELSEALAEGQPGQLGRQVRQVRTFGAGHPLQGPHQPNEPCI